MAEPTAEAGYKEHTTRIISARLLIGIIFLPFVFAWFLLRPGYSTMVRVLGLGWAGLALLGVLSAPTEEELAQQEKAAAAKQAAKPAEQPKPKAIPPKPAAPPEAKYLEILEILERDLRGQGFVRHEDIPQTTWAGSIGVMGSVATGLEERQKYTLSPSAKAEDKRVRAYIASEQAKAFPLLRSIYAKSVDEKVWEFDVDVEARGKANRTLRLTGHWFVTNRNIKGIMDEIHEDVLAMRFERVEFRAHKYDDITWYDIKPLPDTKLATFSHNRWTPIAD